jgi:hypothetical protein
MRIQVQGNIVEELFKATDQQRSIALVSHEITNETILKLSLAMLVVIVISKKI